MKKISVLTCASLWLIICACLVFGQDYKLIHDGIEYAELTREIDKTPIRMNLLRLDLKKVRLDAVHALDSAIGLEKTSSIAARHGAIAAVNAGFFRIDRSIHEGDDVSMLMIDGKILSENNNGRICLLISNGKSETQVNFEHLTVSSTLHARKTNWKISGVNRERKNNELILYTPEFNFTTLTDGNGLEIIVENGKITRIFNGKGSNRIPQNGFVISAGEKFRDELKSLKIGSKLTVESQLNSFSENKPVNLKSLQTEDIISGVPQLIKNGKIDITWQQEKSSKAFVETKHPRTAVAKLKDGKFLMVTIDGRSEASGGISLQNLAELLLEMGATDAMNLDGGGSTTMFLDGKIVNHPSDKEGERKVGDALLVFPRK